MSYKKREGLHIRLQALITMVLVALSIPAAGMSTETVLYSFQGGSDGANPASRLLIGKGGVLYGTTLAGGGSTACSGGCGTVFRLSPPAQPEGAWTETVLHAFSGGGDGGSPIGSLVADGAGSLYGVTKEGSFPGTIFVLKPPSDANHLWRKSVLYRWSANGAEAAPRSIVINENATIYGTAIGGGPYYCGAIFSLAPGARGAAWSENNVYSFVPPRGCNPTNLLIGPEGVLIGSTNADSNALLFALSPPAAAGGLWTETIIDPLGLSIWPGGFSFQNSAVYLSAGLGIYSLAPPTQGGTGWALNLLYEFAFRDTTPPSGVIADENGILYGTTYEGGQTGCDFGPCGTVFALNPPTNQNSQWTEADLHRFQGSDGANPVVGLTMSKNGTLFGSTFRGGASDAGVVFQIN